MTMGRIVRAIAPQRLMTVMQSNPTIHRICGGRPGVMEAGPGRGLQFDPGPSNREYASGRNELPVQEALASCLTPGGVFYDVGANVGFFSVIGAHLAGPSGCVYAFEPVPANVAFIRLNVRLNQLENVNVVQCAVSAQSGPDRLWVAAYSGGGALVVAGVPPDAARIMDVDTVSVDDLIFTQQIKPPSVVKIDVEGAEIQVLEGMARTLREIRPAVIFEIDDAEPGPFEEKFQKCEEFLRGHGYDVRRLENSYPDTKWLVGHAIATFRGAL